MSSFPRLNKNRQGQTRNPDGPEAALAVIRHIAASQAIASDGNKESVKDPPPAAGNEKRTNVKPPVRDEPDHNKAAAEAAPPIVAGDGFARAAAQARKLKR